MEPDCLIEYRISPQVHECADGVQQESEARHVQEMVGSQRAVWLLQPSADALLGKAGI